MIEKVGKECAQHRGVRGQTIGSLVSFIGANGIVMLLVWISSGKREKTNDDNDNKKFDNRKATYAFSHAFIVHHLKWYTKE